MTKNRFLVCLIGLALSLTNSHASAAQILVSTRPIYSIVKNISCDLDVKLMTNKNASPHDFYLKPSNLKDLYKADLIIITSNNLEASLYNLIKKNESLLKKTIILDQIPNIGLIKYGHNKEIKINTHSHEHDEHNHHSHEHFGYDPHIWLSIQNVITISRYLQEYFATLHPNQSRCFAKKTKNFVHRLDHLQVELDSKLTKFANENLIVSHDAYNYLFQKYQINTAGVVIGNFDLPPTVKSLSQLQDAIKNKKVKCVLVEPQLNQNIIDKLFANTDVKKAFVDPEWGPSNVNNSDIYPEMMRQNARAIAACLE